MATLQEHIWNGSLVPYPPADTWIYSPLGALGWAKGQNVKNDLQLGCVECKAGQ